MKEVAHIETDIAMMSERIIKMEDEYKEQEKVKDQREHDFVQ